MAWTVRFVASVAEAAALRFDFNDGADAPGTANTCQVDADNVDFGWPELRRVKASSLGEDGDWISGEAYGNRTMSIPVFIYGTSEQAAAKLTNLMRELDRPFNWLQFKPSANSQSVFFKTYRSSISASDLSAAGANVWILTLTLEAAPFALGVLQTTSMTITNDPSTGTNRLYWASALATFKGDMAAPVRLKVAHNDSTKRAGSTMFVSMRAALSPPSTPYWIESGTTGVTLGTGATRVTADTAMAGGDYINIGFTTNNLDVARVTFSSSVVMPYGMYKVLARVRSPSANQTYKIQHRPSAASSKVLGERFWSSTTANKRDWVDLGNFMHPYGNTLTRTGEEFTSTQTAPYKGSIRVMNTSGTSAFHLDGLLLVPLDVDGLRARSAFIFTGDRSAAPAAIYADAETDTVRQVDASEQVLDVDSPTAYAGALPQVIPGRVNTLHLVATFTPPSGSSVGDTLADSAVATLQYYPRYLFLRPAGD